MRRAARTSASPYPVAHDRAIHAPAGRARRRSRDHRERPAAGGGRRCPRTRTTRGRPSESTRAAFVVVEPASTPRKQDPLSAARSARRTRALPCRARNEQPLRRRGTGDAGAPPRGSARGTARASCPAARRTSTAADSSAESAAPMATKICPCSGTRTAPAPGRGCSRTAGASPAGSGGARRGTPRCRGWACRRPAPRSSGSRRPGGCSPRCPPAAPPR